MPNNYQPVDLSLFLNRASIVEDGPKNLTSAAGATLVILSGPDPVVAKDLYAEMRSLP